MIIHFGLDQYASLVLYIGFWVMCIISLVWRPAWGLYYMIPLVTYRTMRTRLHIYPLGANMLTILVLAVILGAILHGKRLPKSKLYLIWLLCGIYLYFSMWLGYGLGNAPPPLWLSDWNFDLWKDYMVIPLLFVATSLVVEDRKAIKTIIILTALTLLGIDRICLHTSLARATTDFNEAARDNGPLAWGSNLTAAYLAVFAMFFWGFLQFVKLKTPKSAAYKLAGYALIGYTLFATMYTFSRGGYLAILFGVFVLGILKDRKLLVILGVFLLAWQTIVPNAVRERVNMTTDENGQLESSAQERVDLWSESWDSFVQSPILGNGFATFHYGRHTANLTDTHDWFIKVMVETGVVGLIMYFFLLQQMLALGYRLFRHGSDPLYRGLGLGLVIALCSSMMANCFGDRWTFLEITGPLFVLVGAAVRASQLTAEEPLSELSPLNSKAPAATSFA